MEGYLSQIILFAGISIHLPKNWMLCNGQLLLISTYQPLYSLLGTTYGGDGRATFALPDLRGRAPIGVGHGNGLSNYDAGAQGGKEKVDLSIDEMPAHNHEAKLQVASPLGRNDNTSSEAANHYLADGNAYTDKKNNTMPADAITVEQKGNGAAHENRPPYLALNYIICVQGIYPHPS